MKKHYLAKALILLISLGFIFCGTTGAATVSYSLTDLTKTEANLYRITYDISGFDATIYAGLDIYFDYATYSNIDLVAADTANWDISQDYIYQPDAILGEEEDGMLDALSLVSTDSLSGWFTVTFLYTGEDLPGSQYVEYFNEDYTLVTSGRTSAVPVPGAAVLLFSGIAGLFACKRKF